jgi:xanthine dehydrogenase YagS FAD-binding subunit
MGAAVRAFEYVRAGDADHAVATVAADQGASFLAGGTTQLDLMKDGVLAPGRLVDISRLPLGEVARDDAALRVGALTTMEGLAAEPTVVERLPVVREALLAGASVQLRNMATIGGNLLQRTRCRYFRDPTVAACNKRDPGSGCAAIGGSHRMHAILGTSEHCIATHASDLAVALVALDAVVHVLGRDGEERTIPLVRLYRVPAATPEVETVLDHGDLITAVEVPLPSPATRSTYLKVRDRASYEFALASAAVAVEVHRGVVREAGVALGGVGTVPWRAWGAEDVLVGRPATATTFQEAAAVALDGATPLRDNAFKVDLARRTLVRALELVAGDSA